MRKRRRDSDDAHESQESHERWLISYADFITLLFAFFVVMYAISSVNETKYKKVSGALENAFSGPVPKSTENQSSGKTNSSANPSLEQVARALAEQRRQQEKMSEVAKDLTRALGPLISQGKVNISRNARGVKVDISDSVLFAQGQAQLNAASIGLLESLSSVIKDKAVRLEVGGHTDDVPIHNPNFPSNWELSAMRASRVVRLFRDNGVDEYRMTAVGYGSTRPVLPNDTAAARTRNRRVTLMILPIDGPRGLLPEQVELPGGDS
ncbi:MAG: flagellar motor protein MotD [Thiobacillaceae bacterium]